MMPARALVMSSAMCSLLLCGASAAKAQTFGASPQILSFVYQIGGPNPAAQSILLTADVPSSFSVTISGAPWLSVAPVSGITPSTLVATVTAPAGATPGTLNGSIIIGPPASTDAVKTVVAVSLQILAPPQGNLTVTPSSMVFNYTVGASFPTPQSIFVNSTGAPASFNVTTNASWLTVSASSYVTPAAVQVSVFPGPGLTPGFYTGTVFINPTYGGGTQQSVAVTLTVSSAGILLATPNALTFVYQSGQPYPSPQTVSVVNSSGANTGFTVTTTTASGGAWLSCSPCSASTPAGIVISTNPVNLGPGTYSGTVSFLQTTAGANPTQIPVTLQVYGHSQLVVDPPSVTINYQAGGPAPVTQYVGVTSTGTPLSYALRTQGTSWISTTTTGGTTPSGFGVVATPPSGVAAGTYTATISVSPNGGGGTAVSLPVSVVISGANYLTVGRSSVSFDYAPGAPNPAPVIVPVTSSSGPLRFEAVAATLGHAAWLSVSQSSQYTPANITITVSPQGLAAGTYSGSVVINSDDASNGQQQIAVTLNVTTSSLSASPFGLVFSSQLNNGQVSPQVFVVSGSQGAALPFTVTTTTDSGGTWLLAVGNGPTPATVAVGVNPGTLGPGTYTGEIQIKPTDSTIPSLTVPVVFNVAGGPVYQPSANQLTFQYEVGMPTPAAQEVTINATGTGAVFYPTVATADGGTWLSVPTSVTGTPSTLMVSVNPAGLTAGTYYGIIGLNSPAGDIPISFVPVTLQVAAGPILTVPTQPLTFNSIAGVGSLSSQLLDISAPTPTTFHVTTTGGGWLTVGPTDGMTNAQVSVSANPNGMSPGYYLGLLSISIPGIATGQQYVPVVLVITPGFSQ